MKRLIVAALALCSFTWGQGQPVNQVLNPPPANWVSLYWCGSSGTACGSGNLNVTYICSAPAFTSQPTVYAVGAVPALTNIIVSTNVGTITFGATAQLWVGQVITVAGSATTALNGNYKLTAVSGSTATITTSGVSNATYTDMNVTTSQPRLDALVWSILVFQYTNASVNASYYAVVPPVNSQVPAGLACSNRTNY